MSLKTNNFSKDLQVTAPDKPVYFRVLGIKKRKDGKEQIRPTTHVKNVDSIIDPKSGEMIAIECIAHQSTEKVDGVATTITVRQDISFDRNKNGYITIAAKPDTNMPLYQYLTVCNANASNPHRSTNKSPLFQLVDHELDAKKELEKEDILFEAQLFVKEAKYKELQELAPSHKLDPNMAENQLRVEFKHKAKSSPKEFIFNSVPDANKEIENDIKKAIEFGAIEFDSVTNQWMNINKGDNSIMLQLEVVEINDSEGTLAKHLASNNTIYGKLRNKTKKLEEASE